MVHAFVVVTPAVVVFVHVVVDDNDACCRAKLCHQISILFSQQLCQICIVYNYYTEFIVKYSLGFSLPATIINCSIECLGGVRTVMPHHITQLQCITHT